MIDWTKIDNKTILLTGASGLVGKTFIEFVLQRNSVESIHTKIIAVGRNGNKLNRRFQDVKLTNDICFLEHDVNDPLLVDGQIDYIIHLASNTHPRLYATEPINTELTNIFGTKNLLDLAVKKENCTFFFMSSTDVYGQTDQEKKFISEKDFGYVDCNTLRAGYIEGKKAGEALCAAYHEEKGINYFIGRLCRTFGRNMQMDDSRAISQFILKAVCGEDVVLKSSGEQLYSYLNAYDVVTAILCILSKGKNCEAYNIADNEQTMRLKDLAKRIAEIGHVGVVFAESDAIEAKGAGNFMNVCLDSTKLNSLGWKPKTSLDKGLEETISDIKRTYSSD